MPKAAIFDMDGTILDTTVDLTASLNYALEKTGHRHDYTGEHTRLFFGSGALVALMRALACEGGTEPSGLLALGTRDCPAPRELREEAERALPVFKTYYPQHSGIFTRPYPGVPGILERLRRDGVRTAVVSNKMEKAVEGLCARYFPGLFDAAAGENEPAVRRKPAPDMIEKTLETLGVSARETVYVGDSEVDLETAENAGIALIAVSWGFRSKEFLRSRGAGIIADGAEELYRAISSFGEKSGGGEEA